LAYGIRGDKSADKQLEVLKLDFVNLNIRRVYDSEEDDILHGFYIPVLANSNMYYRLAGFFSSSALAVAARGIKGLLKNQGEMKLVVGAAFRKEDVEAIRKGIEKPDEVIEKMCLRNLENIENEFIKNHISALSWLVAKGKLEIKIAVISDNKNFPLDKQTVDNLGIFHQKVGIFVDSDGKMISFSGSINETAKGWTENIEEFKVFRSWVESESIQFQSDLKKFQKFWDGKAHRIKIFNMPDAIKNAIIRFVPSNVDDLELEPPPYIPTDKDKIQLRPYQHRAIEAWIKNGYRGLFEMATGTGKTYVALGCAKEIFKIKRMAIVISCPSKHLPQQWENEIQKFGIECKKIVAFGNYHKWKDKLTDGIVDFNNNIYKTILIFTTHATAMREHFLEQINKINSDILFIADEVHWLGAPKLRKALNPKYKFRIGLSATPKRWLDKEGTHILDSFFGGTVFEFPLKRAIAEGFLVPYEYYPIFVSLTDEELDDYREKTKRIARLYDKAKEDEKKAELLEHLLRIRQDIIKGAREKIEAFERLMNTFEEISHTLVYCNDHNQMNWVQDILSKIGVVHHEFTGEESEKERKDLLDNFARGNYQILTAMKCLDEGIDVPPTKLAIILASSGNPKQYIQRRGRILRKYEGKEKAIIHDFLVVPNISESYDRELYEIEKKIFRKELKRYKEFAGMALNHLGALKIIMPIMEKYGIYGGEE